MPRIKEMKSDKVLLREAMSIMRQGVREAKKKSKDRCFPYDWSKLPKDRALYKAMKFLGIKIPCQG